MFSNLNLLCASYEQDGLWFTLSVQPHLLCLPTACPCLFGNPEQLLVPALLYLSSPAHTLHFFFFLMFISHLLALGPRCRTGFSLAAVHKLLAVVASGCSAWMPRCPGFGRYALDRRLSSCGTWAESPCSMRELPSQGSNPWLLHSQADAHPAGHQGSRTLSVSSGLPTVPHTRLSVRTVIGCQRSCFSAPVIVLTHLHGADRVIIFRFSPH